MLQNQHLIGFGARIKPLAFSYQTETRDTVDRSTYTFASLAAGPEHSSRILVVTMGAAAAGAFTVSSVTIGGVTATPILETFNGTNNVAGIYAALVPTGTSITVVVTLSTTVARCGVGLFNLIGYSITPTDTLGSTAAAPTGTIDCVAKGAIIAEAYNNFASSCTWTGLTERADQTMEGMHSIAGDQFATAQTSLTVTATFGTSSTPAMSVASFAPL